MAGLTLASAVWMEQSGPVWETDLSELGVHQVRRSGMKDDALASVLSTWEGDGQV